MSSELFQICQVNPVFKILFLNKTWTHILITLTLWYLCWSDLRISLAFAKAPNMKLVCIRLCSAVYEKLQHTMQTPAGSPFVCRHWLCLGSDTLGSYKLIRASPPALSHSPATVQRKLLTLSLSLKRSSKHHQTDLTMLFCPSHPCSRLLLSCLLLISLLCRCLQSGLILRSSVQVLQWNQWPGEEAEKKSWSGLRPRLLRSSGEKIAKEP